MAKIIKAYTPITAGIQEKDEILVPMIIDEYIDKVGTGLVGPYICVVNENPISRKHWGSLVIQKNDIVLFLGFPQGGEGGSSPVKAILTIALMAAALTVPGAAFAAGSFFAGGFGGALVSGTIMFGGSYLLNLAFPPQVPAQVGIGDSARSGSSLSSYNINDRGNNAALGNVITVQYGRIKNYPKYAMQSWSKFIANEQYAYLLFCQGQGQYEFEEYNFGTVSSDQLEKLNIVTFDSNDVLPNVDGAYFYDNVFTSDQVQNVEVKRVGELTVTVPDTLSAEIAVTGVGYLQPGSGLINDKIQVLDGPLYDPLWGAGNITIGGAGAANAFLGSYDVISQSVSGASFFTDVDIPSLTSLTSLAGHTLRRLYPKEVDQLTYIDSETIIGSITIPFENGIRGSEEIYGGFQPGDTFDLYDSVTTATTQYTILSTYYYTHESIEYVAYELFEAVPNGDPLPSESYMEFVGSDQSDGYILPNLYSVIEKFEVDVSFPNGIYKVNQTTGDPETTSVKFDIKYKILLDGGSEPAAWTTAQTVILSKATKSPVNDTYSIDLPSSATPRKIIVRIDRDFEAPYEWPDTSSEISQMYFSQLKVFLENTNYYGDVTMIAVKVKVSNSLVQASLSKFNTVSTRKLPIYTTSWSANTATRNPAWAIADACRNSEYSLGIPDADIDIDELVSLAAIWDSRQDYCDGLFENKEVFWDSLRKICKVGRAQPLMIAGAVGFVRDQPKTIPTQVFSSDNIQFGSFNVDCIPFDDDTPNSVEMEYFDEDEWIWKKTLQTIPGGDTTQPANLQVWGITTEDHAIRDAKYESACNAYRRKLPNFTTELEGRILKRLDYISVSSPRVGWGISGHIVNVDGNELELSEPIEFVSGSYYIAFREKNGSQDGPYLVTEVVDSPKKVLMGVTPPSFIYTGYEYEKTHFQFGQGDSYDRKALVSTVQPQQLESVQITCIIDDERVYTADGTTGI